MGGRVEREESTRKGFAPQKLEEGEWWGNTCIKGLMALERRGKERENKKLKEKVRSSIHILNRQGI